jgi:hypothetical protein
MILGNLTITMALGYNTPITLIKATSISVLPMLDIAYMTHLIVN